MEKYMTHYSIYYYRMEWTNQQADAINNLEGNMQIIACAGSGKTEVLTERIKKLIKSGIDPGNIIAFTFTENAADDMKSKIQRKIMEHFDDDMWAGDLFIGTIHSFCWELLQHYKPEYRGYEPLDENTQLLYLEKNFWRLNLHNFDVWAENNYGKAKKFLKNANMVREELIDEEIIKNEAPDFWKSYQKYIEMLQEDKYIDYENMIYESIQMLENEPDIREEINKRWKYLLIDEYQDINPSQERLIQLLNSSDNVCVVGDDDQSIYEWRGADVNNILEFEDRYDDVETFNLEKNFRSTKNIVKLANNVISNNDPDRLEKEMFSDKEGDLGDIYYCRFEEPDEEVDFVLNKIQHLLGTIYDDNLGKTRKIDYSDIAILVRTKKESAKFVDVFREEEIPYNVVGQGGLFARVETVVAFSMLLAVYSNSKEEAEKIIEQIKEKLQDGLDLNEEKFEDIKSELLEIRKNIIHDDWADLQGTYHDVLSLFYPLLQDRDDFDVISHNIGRLSDVISDFESIHRPIKTKNVEKELSDFLEEYAMENYDEGVREEQTPPNAVNIMTIHKAKGLEYSVVFVPGLTRGNFPNRRPSKGWMVPTDIFDKDRYDGSDESERRLFYVALTRSRKYLFLTSSPVHRSAKRASDFVDEIEGDFIIKGPKPDPTEREEGEGITETLEKVSTSFSDLSYYDICPYSYKLRNIYGINPGIDVALGYGKGLHNTLAYLHSNFSEDLPEEDELENIVDTTMFMRYAHGEVEENLMNKAKEIIDDYVDKFGDEFKDYFESEKKFEYPLELSSDTEITLKGQIDMLKQVEPEDEVPDEVHILDFKSSKDDKDSKVRATKMNTRQLQLYALACKEVFGYRPTEAYVHHLCDNTRDKVEINEEKIEEAKERVLKQTKKIKKDKFPPKPGKDGENCEYCDYSDFCPHEKTD